MAGLYKGSSGIEPSQEIKNIAFFVFKETRWGLLPADAPHVVVVGLAVRVDTAIVEVHVVSTGP